MLVLAAVLAVALPAPSAAQDPDPGTPAWHAREAANFALTLQRPLDRAAQGLLTPDSDPRRALDRWAPARGAALETHFANRYGASIMVTLLHPRGEQPRPLPSVVLVPGFGTGVRQAYYSFAQDLAEHGYLVLVFDPQAQGRSDRTGRPETCEPGGAWQRPQEMGLRERGPCAGQPPPQPPAGDAAGTYSLVAHGLVGSGVDHRSTADTYRAIAPTFVLGTLDAVGWLLSDANPWRAWVDPARVGAAGHSAGAYGAAQAANGDPHNRFRAAAALDGYHPVDLGVGPRVPTLWLQSEQENAPRLAPPKTPRSLHPTWASFDAFRAAGVPAALLTLRGSTHLDFADAVLPASRDGGRVASYLMLAWFDRFLRGDRSATARLFAERFDDSVDRSSIGTGALDARGENVPPAIAGRRVADALSYYYPGALAAFGADCRDPRLVPCVLPAPLLRARVTRPSGRRLTAAITLARGDLPPARVRLVRGRRVLARLGRRLDLGHSAREHSVTLRLGRRARGPRRATLVVDPGGAPWRFPVRIPASAG